MDSKPFLLVNLALAFYLVGVIWAHEIDIFRSWKLISARDFATVQSVHAHELPYWIFAPLGLALIGSVVLLWHHPSGSPPWAIWGNLACQLASHVLTAISWGPWQTKLSKDVAGRRVLI